ncbi:hypothetical protein ACETK8_10225 [Brevundimonas staleyi]|uniref:Uncharacterized protein n=1 Tax=Brevundimonas staleyi TaxID=74326 RepID=A0ABW0FRK5_9CAUL
MSTITFKQIDRALGLSVAMGYLAVTMGGLIAVVGFFKLATFVDEFGSVKGLAILAVILFVAPPIFMVMALYKRTEVRFTSDAIEVMTRGQAASKRIPIAAIATADLNRSQMGALSLFGSNGRLLHRFAPYNDSTSLEALIEELVRAGSFRVESVPVRVFGTMAAGRVFTRR